MDMERDDQVIYFKDLIFAALYSWRRLLAAGLVLGVVVGALCGVSMLGGNDSQQTEPVVVDDPLVQALEKAELAVAQQEEYNRDSQLMHVDPYNIYAATVELTVDADYQIQPGLSYQNPDISETLLYAYQAQLSAEPVLGKAAEAVGVQTRYLQEMVKAEILPTARSLRFSVGCIDRQTGEQVLQVLTESLSEVQEAVAKTMGEHKVILLSGSVIQSVDEKIAEKQTLAKERLSKLEDELAEAQAAMPAETITRDMSAKKAVLLVCISVIAGAGIVACVVWLKHIAGDCVYSERVLQNKTGVKVLGGVPGENIKNPIDRWLRKLEGRSVDMGRLAVLAADVANRCPGKKLLVVGDAKAKSRTALAEALQAAGVQVGDMGSLLQDAAGVKALPEYDAVLLVEQCGVSKYYNVRWSAEVAADHGKQLLGCVLLDG